MQNMFVRIFPFGPHHVYLFDSDTQIHRKLLMSCNILFGVIDVTGDMHKHKKEQI